MTTAERSGSDKSLGCEAFASFSLGRRSPTTGLQDWLWVMVAFEKLHIGRMRLLSSSTDVSTSVVNGQYREIRDQKSPYAQARTLRQFRNTNFSTEYNNLLGEN
jgi:hypothetical protein